MEDGREQKAVVALRVQRADGVRADARDLRRAGRHAGQQVGGAGFGGRGFVAVLAYEQQRGGQDGGGGADVEGVVGVAAGAYYVALFEEELLARGEEEEEEG